MAGAEAERESKIVGVPEPGQLVEVRRRQWVVADVLASEIHEAGKTPQHLITLSSIDEDGLGEELQVIWEIEPGAHIIEKAGLPEITGFDHADKLDAFLDAVRWGAATNADRGFLQAPFRSGVSIEDFQLDPLVRAINMARVNLLIADDVGLGKTKNWGRGKNKKWGGEPNHLRCHTCHRSKSHLMAYDQCLSIQSFEAGQWQAKDTEESSTRIIQHPMSFLAAESRITSSAKPASGWSSCTWSSHPRCRHSPSIQPLTFC